MSVADANGNVDGSACRDALETEMRTKMGSLGTFTILHTIAKADSTVSAPDSLTWMLAAAKRVIALRGTMPMELLLSFSIENFRHSRVELGYEMWSRKMLPVAPSTPPAPDHEVSTTSDAHFGPHSSAGSPSISTNGPLPGSLQLTPAPPRTVSTGQDRLSAPSPLTSSTTLSARPTPSACSAANPSDQPIPPIRCVSSHVLYDYSGTPNNLRAAPPACTCSTVNHFDQPIRSIRGISSHVLYNYSGMSTTT